jgi:hypothetical protein
MGQILSCEGCDGPKEAVEVPGVAETPRDTLLQKLFGIVDQNNSGTLDVQELAKVMDNADEFLRVCDADSDSMITRQEFLDWSSNHIVRHLTGMQCLLIPLNVFATNLYHPLPLFRSTCR